MAISSTRQTIIQYTGDLVAGFVLDAAVNEVSTGVVNLLDLASGNNTIPVFTTGPTSEILPTSVTIVPPADNEETITLKGVNGDTGVKLHPTDPTTIALDPSVASFVLNVTGDVLGVRFYWA